MYVYTNRRRIFDVALIVFAAFATLFAALDASWWGLLLGGVMFVDCLVRAIRRVRWSRATTPAGREAYLWVLRELELVVDKDMPRYAVVSPDERSRIDVVLLGSWWRLFGHRYLVERIALDDDCTDSFVLASRTRLFFPMLGSSKMTATVSQVELLEDGRAIPITQQPGASFWRQVRDGMHATECVTAEDLIQMKWVLQEGERVGRDQLNF